MGIGIILQFYRSLLPYKPQDLLAAVFSSLAGTMGGTPTETLLGIITTSPLS